MTRFRKLAAWLAACGLALGLASCANIGGMTSAQAIADVQGQANIVTAAITAGAKQYNSSPSVPGSQVMAIDTAVTELQAANAILQGQQNIATLASAAGTFSTDVDAVLAMLPLDPLTKAAVAAATEAIATIMAAEGVTPAPATSA